MRTKSGNSSGFTLLELIVVLAGLGMLSSLALPPFIDLLDSSKVDEIKALLNSAAADCLEQTRNDTGDRVIDEEIISDEIIKSIGYEIDQDRTLFKNDKPSDGALCDYFYLKPTKGDAGDSVRYNIGFSVEGDGTVDKLGDTADGDKKADCTKWAGKCTFSEEAKKLLDYKNQIKEAEDACDSALDNWEKNGMIPVESQQWDSSKGPDTCPSTPPAGGEAEYKGKDFCTTEGCTAPIWGLWDSETKTGTTYNTEDDYKEAREILIGAQCAKQIKEDYEDTKFTNPNSSGVKLGDCNNDPYWFIEGKDMGSESEWKEGMCEENKQKLLGTTHSDSVEYCTTDPIYICGGKEITGDNAEADFATCLATNKDAQCTQALNDDALSRGSGGEYTSPTPEAMTAPVGEDCGEKYYYCEKSKKIYKGPDAKEKYDADKECEVVMGGPGCIPKNEYYCAILPGSEHCECQ